MSRSVLLMLGMCICALAQGSEYDLIRGQWRQAGHDFANSRSQPAEVLIGPQNVQSLAVKWVFTTDGDISATPTVFGDAVFFPDWAGNLYAVNKHTGQLIWSHKISEYDGFSTALSRTSPAVHGDDVIVGDIEARFALHTGASIIAADRRTGALHWITRVDSHISAQITGSPVVFGDVVYVGVSSQEEAFALAGSELLLHLPRQRGSTRCQHRKAPVEDLHGAGQRRQGGRLQRRPGLAAASHRSRSRPALRRHW